MKILIIDDNSTDIKVVLKEILKTKQINKDSLIIATTKDIMLNRITIQTVKESDRILKECIQEIVDSSCDVYDKVIRIIEERG